MKTTLVRWPRKGFPTSDFRLLTSDFRLPTSDFRLRTSDFGLQTSDFRLPTSDFRLQTSDFGLRTSDFRLPTSDFRLQTSDFGLQTSDFRLRTSDFGLPTSDFRLQTSDFRTTKEINWTAREEGRVMKTTLAKNLNKKQGTFYFQGKKVESWQFYTACLSVTHTIQGFKEVCVTQSNTITKATLEFTSFRP